VQKVVQGGRTGNKISAALPNKERVPHALAFGRTHQTSALPSVLHLARLARLLLSGTRHAVVAVEVAHAAAGIVDDLRREVGDLVAAAGRRIHELDAIVDRPIGGCVLLNQLPLGRSHLAGPVVSVALAPLDRRKFGQPAAQPATYLLFQVVRDSTIVNPHQGCEERGGNKDTTQKTQAR